MNNKLNINYSFYSILLLVITNCQLFYQNVQIYNIQFFVLAKCWLAGETNQSFDLLDPRKGGREEKKRRETGVEKRRSFDKGIPE